MKVLIVYFSWTGYVEKLARHLRAQLQPFGEVVMARIEPMRQHGYWIWLACSFLPGLRVPIRPVTTDLGEYDVVCLGFPKWTVSCPPVNQYIQLIQLKPGKSVGLFMSYGGFYQECYLRSMIKKVSGKGAQIVAVASIKRSAIRDGSFHDSLERFCREIL
jgi:hypothetical protein